MRRCFLSQELFGHLQNRMREEHDADLHIYWRMLGDAPADLLQCYVEQLVPEVRGETRFLCRLFTLDIDSCFLLLTAFC